MQYLKFIRGTILTIILTHSSLSAQTETTQYRTLRWDVVPGQEQAFFQAQAAARSAEQIDCDQGWEVYLYHDHVLELRIPLAAETVPTCRLTEIAGHYLNANTESMIAGQTTYSLDRHPELSYTPAGHTPAYTACPYFELVAYRVAPGRLKEAHVHLQKLTAILQKMDSPLEVLCYTRTDAAGETLIEMVYPAEDPDDLAERRAAHERRANGALRQWRKEMPLLVDRLRVTSGRHVYELSNRAGRIVKQ